MQQNKPSKIPILFLCIAKNLSGSGLVVSLNDSEQLSINFDGEYSFKTGLKNTDSYFLNIVTQPSTPKQNCEFSSSYAHINDNIVTGIILHCVTDKFRVGGILSIASNDVSKLVISVNDEAVDISVNLNYSFEFNKYFDDSSKLTFGILQPPDFQDCEFNTSTIIIAGDNVNDLVLNCSFDSSAIVVGDDFFTVSRGDIVNLPNVLANDIDNSSGNKPNILGFAPINADVGTLIHLGNGDFTFNPSVYVIPGLYNFTYQVENPFGSSIAGIVTLEITNSEWSNEYVLGEGVYGSIYRKYIVGDRIIFYYYITSEQDISQYYLVQYDASSERFLSKHMLSRPDYYKHLVNYANNTILFFHKIPAASSIGPTSISYSIYDINADTFGPFTDIEANLPGRIDYFIINEDKENILLSWVETINGIPDTTHQLWAVCYCNGIWGPKRSIVTYTNTSGTFTHRGYFVNSVPIIYVRYNTNHFVRVYDSDLAAWSQQKDIVVKSDSVSSKYQNPVVSDTGQMLLLSTQTLTSDVIELRVNIFELSGQSFTGDTTLSINNNSTDTPLILTSNFDRNGNMLVQWRHGSIFGVSSIYEANYNSINGWILPTTPFLSDADNYRGIYTISNGLDKAYLWWIVNPNTGLRDLYAKHLSYNNGFQDTQYLHTTGSPESYTYLYNTSVPNEYDLSYLTNNEEYNKYYYRKYSFESNKFTAQVVINEQDMNINITPNFIRTHYNTSTHIAWRVKHIDDTYTSYIKQVFPDGSLGPRELIYPDYLVPWEIVKDTNNNYQMVAAVNSNIVHMEKKANSTQWIYKDLLVPQSTDESVYGFLIVPDNSPHTLFVSTVSRSTEDSNGYPIRYYTKLAVRLK